MKVTGQETKRTVEVSSLMLRATPTRVTGSTTASMVSAVKGGNQMRHATRAVSKTARRMARGGTSGPTAATTRATLLTECSRDRVLTSSQTLEKRTQANSRMQTCMASVPKSGKTAKRMRGSSFAVESKAKAP